MNYRISPTLLRINLVLLILLSLATGLVKVLRMPAEMDLFAKAGFGEQGVTALGLLQMMGALMLLFQRSRRTGAIAMAGTFVFASAVVFLAGMIPFGIFSLLFIGMALLTYFRPVTFTSAGAQQSTEKE